MSNNSQKKISRLVIVQARTGSTRLPNKILQDLGGKNLLTVFMERVTKAVEPDNIVIATGSTPRKLPNIEVDEKIIMSSDGIGHMKDFPESMVILGAGVIGCEFASIFANIGKTKVYIIDKQDRILPFEDEDISELISNNLTKKGVHIHKNTQLQRMDIVNDRVEFA